MPRGAWRGSYGIRMSAPPHLPTVALTTVWVVKATLDPRRAAKRTRRGAKVTQPAHLSPLPANATAPRCHRPAAAVIAVSIQSLSPPAG
jgi:hypothetical protein